MGSAGAGGGGGRAVAWYDTMSQQLNFNALGGVMPINGSCALSGNQNADAGTVYTALCLQHMYSICHGVGALPNASASSSSGVTLSAYHIESKQVQLQWIIDNFAGQCTNRLSFVVQFAAAE